MTGHNFGEHAETANTMIRFAVFADAISENSMVSLSFWMTPVRDGAKESALCAVGFLNGENITANYGATVIVAILRISLKN